MAEGKEHGFFRGAGGIVWTMDLPLGELYADQMAKGELVRVEEDGSTYTGPPTPIVGGRTTAIDPKDAEIQALRDRIAELEAGKATEPEPPATPKRPANSAAKPDWVAWAVAQGADPADAEAMTKDKLVEAYGGQ